MKKHLQNENYRLRVRAETLRYLGRTELAVVDGGQIVSGGGATIFAGVAVPTGTGATNVAAAAEPTGTITTTRVA